MRPRPISLTLASLIFALLALSVCPSTTWCEEKKAAESKRRQARQDVGATSEPKQVEFHAAMREGLIDVTVVPQSYAVLTLRVRNRSQEPLKIEIPPSIAAVPVARVQAVQTMQAQGMPASLADSYGQGTGNSQGLGASLAGPWSRGTAIPGNDPGIVPAQKPGVAEGPRFWTLAPREVFLTQVPCFCLEYGRPDPHSRIPYQLCDLNDLNGRPAVKELLDQFGKQGINQNVAQLAIWHTANQVPWPMLAKVQFPRTPGSKAHHVTPMELMAAKQLAESMPSYGRTGSLADQ